MAFLKIQKLKVNEDGEIMSGSASIMETLYAPDVKGHSRHKTRMALGKVLYLAPDRKSGVFLSSQGLVAYDSQNDELSFVSPDDQRIAGRLDIPQPQPRTTFGDVYLFVCCLRDEGWLNVFRKVFPENKQYERFLAHLVHGFLSDGSHVKCDTFIEQSAIAHVLTDVPVSSLHRDSIYFDLMGTAVIKKAYFQAFADWMRETETQFGLACYVDSTPLPNDMKDNPLNALRCDPKTGCHIEMRLGLVLDEVTDLPVWYQLFPGNEIDSSTFLDALDDVKASLGINVISVVVDAGYINKEVVKSYAGAHNKTFLARMPNRKGYPYETLYESNKDILFSFDYDFLREGKAYFGYKEPIDLFDTDLYAYVYLDKSKALHESNDYRVRHEAEFARMNSVQRSWCCVRFGFFILVSNRDATPEEILVDYIRRVSIEGIFKTGKEYLSLLPLAKWTKERVCGKILQDMIETTIRSKMHTTLPNHVRDLMDWFHMAASLSCVIDNDVLRIDTPNKQAREAFDYFGVKIPTKLALREWQKDLLIA